MNKRTYKKHFSDLDFFQLNLLSTFKKWNIKKLKQFIKYRNKIDIKQMRKIYYSLRILKQGKLK